MPREPVDPDRDGGEHKGESRHPCGALPFATEQKPDQENSRRQLEEHQERGNRADQCIVPAAHHGREEQRAAEEYHRVQLPRVVLAKHDHVEGAQRRENRQPPGLPQLPQRKRRERNGPQNARMVEELKRHHRAGELHARDGAHHEAGEGKIDVGKDGAEAWVLVRHQGRHSAHVVGIVGG